MFYKPVNECLNCFVFCKHYYVLNECIVNSVNEVAMRYYDTPCLFAGVFVCYQNNSKVIDYGLNQISRNGRSSAKYQSVYFGTDPYPGCIQDGFFFHFFSMDF